MIIIDLHLARYSFTDGRGCKIIEEYSRVYLVNQAPVVVKWSIYVEGIKQYESDYCTVGKCILISLREILNQGGIVSPQTFYVCARGIDEGQECFSKEYIYNAHSKRTVIYELRGTISTIEIEEVN